MSSKKNLLSFKRLILLFLVCLNLFCVTCFAQDTKPKIKVSVIVPVYNTQNYLRDCLDSIVNQSLQELEIILINDGSKDDSLKILREYESKDARIKVIDQKNSGVSAARNAGLRVAQGDYITFCDSDDILHPKAYDTSLTIAQKNHADIFVFSINGFNDGDKVIFQDFAASNIKIYNGGLDVIASTWKQFFSMCNKIYKKEFLRVNNLFCASDMKGHGYEDAYFNFVAFPKANKIAVIDNEFYFYRQRKSSMTKTTSLKDFSEDYFLYFKHVLETYESYDILNGNELWLLEKFFLYDNNIEALIKYYLSIAPHRADYSRRLLNLIEHKLIAPLNLRHEKIPYKLKKHIMILKIYAEPKFLKQTALAIKNAFLFLPCVRI